MLDFILWNPDPILCRIFGWPIRWYSLCWCMALLLGYLNMARLYRKQNIPDEIFSPLFFYCFFGVLIGARLGHCLFYEPNYFLGHLSEMFLPIRHTAEGWQMIGYEGLSSHGGVLGMIIGIWLYCRKTKVNILRVLDNMGIATPLSAAFIRLGNLMNSEIVGNQTDLPWGFIFAANGENFARHPAQLYESIFYVFIFILGLILYNYQQNKKKVGTGFFFGWCLTTIFTFRFFIEFLKADQVDAEASMLINIGQLLSLPLIAIGIYCLVGGKYCIRFAEKSGQKKYVIPQKDSKKKK